MLPTILAQAIPKTEEPEISVYSLYFLIGGVIVIFATIGFRRLLHQRRIDRVKAESAEISKQHRRRQPNRALY
jgi:hypothetical protein